MGRRRYRICEKLFLMPWRSAPGQHSHAARGNEEKKDLSARGK